MTAVSSHRPHVGVVYPLQFPEVEARLNLEARVDYAADLTDQAVSTLMPTVEGLVARGPLRITAEHIASAPDLKIIAATGSGTNHIDVDAASARGILVTSGAGVAPAGVAEYVLGALIVGHRQMLHAHDVLVSGSLEWRNRATDFCPTGLRGEYLGLVGFGNIARTVARMAVAALDMKIMAFDPYASHVSGVTMVDSLDELFASSCAVSVHTPLTPQTRGLVGLKQLRLLGPSGVLINTSRGGVVEESAVLESLRTGLLGSAWMDVFDPEPPGPAQLEAYRQTPRLIVTPHMAGITMRTRQLLEANAVNQVLRVLSGQEPTTAINENDIRMQLHVSSARTSID